MFKYVVPILLLTGCAHVRNNSLYIDTYNPQIKQYVDAHYCKLPIRVYLDLPYNDSIRVKNGLAFWERYAGNQIFTVVEKNEPYDAVFQNYLNEYHGPILGKTKNVLSRMDGCIFNSVVYFFNPLNTHNEWTADFLVRHEVGHVLGLDDSMDDYRIMYGYDNGLHPQEPTESEIKAVKRFYGKQGK